MIFILKKITLNTMSQINQNLYKLSITLSHPTTPVANYIPFVKLDNKVFISGQLPIQDGELKFIGKLGDNISTEDGQKAAKICAINLLSHLKIACDGNLDKVLKCVKLGIFVNATADFTDHPIVANGASDLMVKIFGDNGKHSRFAVGVTSLPCGAAVEIDAIFEVL